MAKKAAILQSAPNHEEGRRFEANDRLCVHIAARPGWPG
jgi:hypothetical protein